MPMSDNCIAFIIAKTLSFINDAWTITDIFAVRYLSSSVLSNRKAEAVANACNQLLKDEQTLSIVNPVL